jgi:hypothetical protein
MEIKELLPYTFAIVTGIGSWFGSYIMATRKSKREFNQEIEKLNIAHKHQLELMEKQNQNVLLQSLSSELGDVLKEEFAKSGAKDAFRSGVKSGINKRQ